MEEELTEERKREVYLKASVEWIKRKREWREWKRSERGDGYGRRRREL